MAALALRILNAAAHTSRTTALGSSTVVQPPLARSFTLLASSFSPSPALAAATPLILSGAMGKKNFYAVRRGRQTGVYTSWEETRRHVVGFAGAHFQGFVTRAEAFAWMEQVGGVRQTAMPAAAAMQHQLRPAQQSQYPPPSYHAAAAAAGLQFAESLVDPARGAYGAAAAARSHAHPYVHREPALRTDRYSPDLYTPHLSPGGRQSLRGFHTSARSSSVITDSCCSSSSQDSLPGLERPDGTRVKRETGAAAAAAASSSAAAAAASPASAASSSSAAAVTASSGSSSVSPSPTFAAAAALPPRYGLLFADGAAKSNPTGPCGCGGILYEATPPLAGVGSGDLVQGAGITCYKRFLGVRSNNEAEYSALIVGLEAALAHGITHLTVRMDSELVVRQMAGEYTVKAANLLPLYNQALQLAARFVQINVQHIYRDQNKEADELANEAITDAIGGNGAAAGAGQRQQQPNRYRRDYY